MKRSFFLACLALLVVAPFQMIARAVKPSRPVRFYWCYEDSEIYAARDLEELNSIMDEMHGTEFAVFDFENRQTWHKRHPDEYPRLTLANRGQQWGEVSGEGIVKVENEEGGYTEMTYRECIAEFPFEPCQVATAYF